MPKAIGSASGDPSRPGMGSKIESVADQPAKSEPREAETIQGSQNYAVPEA